MAHSGEDCYGEETDEHGKLLIRYSDPGFEEVPPIKLTVESNMKGIEDFQQACRAMAAAIGFTTRTIDDYFPQ